MKIKLPILNIILLSIIILSSCTIDHQENLSDEITNQETSLENERRNENNSDVDSKENTSYHTSISQKSNDDEEQEKITFDYKEGNTYYNSKYDFEIVYPGEWVASEESPLGDGVILYDNNGNDIRVYGGYRIIPPDFVKEEIEEKRKSGMDVTEKMNLQGRNGYLILGEEDEKKYFRYIILGQDTYCSFYAKIDENFYEKNKEVLIDIAMALSLYER